MYSVRSKTQLRKKLRSLGENRIKMGEIQGGKGEAGGAGQAADCDLDLPSHALDFTHFARDFHLSGRNFVVSTNPSPNRNRNVKKVDAKKENFSRETKCCEMFN